MQGFIKAVLGRPCQAGEVPSERENDREHIDDFQSLIYLIKDSY